MLQNITLLIDNRLPEANPDALLKEHGLSIYFELNQEKWLFDVGASGKFAKNAERLGIDVSGIDHLVISHGHNDHGGGLRNFLSLNEKADIYISDKIPGSRCFTCRRLEKRAIGIDPRIFDTAPGRFKRVNRNMLAGKDIALVFSSCRDFPMPLANKTLSYAMGEEMERPDDFSHEVSIAVQTEKGLVILSACSHTGVLNILESCCNFWNNPVVDKFIGGTHLVEGDFEKEEDIRALAIKMDQKHPSLKLYTGHCTCDKAMEILKTNMQERLISFYSGMTIPDSHI